MSVLHHQDCCHGSYKCQALGTELKRNTSQNRFYDIAKFPRFIGAIKIILLM